MVQAVQEKEWAKSNTKLIIGKINEVFNSITLNDSTERSIKERDVAQLINILENMVKNPVQLKYYIFTYLFENYYMDEGKNEYTDICEDDYREKLDKLFEEMGIDKRERKKLLKKLEQPIIGLDRRTIFKYAIGLNMDEEVVSILIKKGLLQREINPRDYEELIYRWCIRNVNPKERLNRVKELLYDYNENSFPLNSEVEDKLFYDELKVENDDITYVLIEKVNEILNKDEVEFRLFLKSLKEADLRTNESTSLEDEYWKLVSHLCRIDITTGEVLSDEISWEGLEENKKAILGKVRKEHIKKENKEFFEYEGESIPILDKEVLEKILEDINLSRKYFEGRIDRGKRDYEKAKKEELLKKGKRKKGKLLYYMLTLNDDKIDKELLHQNIVTQLEIDNFNVEAIDYIDDYQIDVNITLKIGNDYEVIRMRKTKIKKTDTEETVEAYVEIKEKISITRKDILFIKFLLYANGYGKNMHKLKSISVHGFMRDANFMLNSVGMLEIYVNNPFDLFIIICFMQKDPLKYFINNWAVIDKNN